MIPHICPAIVWIVIISSALLLGLGLVRICQFKRQTNSELSCSELVSLNELPVSLYAAQSANTGANIAPTQTPTLLPNFTAANTGALLRLGCNDSDLISDLGAHFPSRVPEGFCRANRSHSYFQHCRSACMQDPFCLKASTEFSCVAANISLEAPLRVSLMVRGRSRPRFTVPPNDTRVCDDDLRGQLRGPAIVPFRLLSQGGPTSSGDCFYEAVAVVPLPGRYVATARVVQLGGLQHLDASDVIVQASNGKVDCRYKSVEARRIRYPTNQTNGWLNMELGSMALDFVGRWPSSPAECSSVLERLDNLWLHHSTAANLSKSCGGDVSPDLDPRDDYMYVASYMSKFKRVTVDEALKGKKVVFMGDSTLEEIFRHLNRMQNASLAKSISFSTVWGIYDTVYGKGLRCTTNGQRMSIEGFTDAVKSKAPDVLVLNEGLHNAPALPPREFEERYHQLLGSIRKVFTGKLIIITINFVHESRCPGQKNKGALYLWSTAFSVDGMRKYAEAQRRLASIHGALVLDSYNISFSRPESSRDQMHQDMSNSPAMSSKQCSSFLEGDWTAAATANSINLSPTKHPDSTIRTKAQILLNMIMST